MSKSLCGDVVVLQSVQSTYFLSERLYINQRKPKSTPMTKNNVCLGISRKMPGKHKPILQLGLQFYPQYPTLARFFLFRTFSFWRTFKSSHTILLLVLKVANPKVSIALFTPTRSQQNFTALDYGRKYSHQQTKQLLMILTHLITNYNWQQGNANAKL